jgi:hypothetical protein
MDTNLITLKISNLPEFNEKDYVQMKYDEALQNMLASPTEANIKAFEDANARYWEVMDAYRLGKKLLIGYHADRIPVSHLRSQALQRL